MERTHSAAVLDALTGLKEDQQLLCDMTMQMWNADGSGVYTLDLFANGAIHRSLALIKGFRSMIREFNMICAGPLVRMQLDTALRFHAAYLAPNAFDFADATLSGTEVYKLKTRDGKSMRDAVLVESLTKQYPWVEAIYKQASGFVHLSKVHTVGTYGKPDTAACVVPVAITGEDSDLPDSVYLDTIGTFRAAVEVFTDHLNGWIRLKEGQPTANIVSLTPPPDGDFSRCNAYLDIRREDAPTSS
jgi:hypothetical protein